MLLGVSKIEIKSTRSSAEYIKRRKCEFTSIYLNSIQDQENSWIERWEEKAINLCANERCLNKL